MASSSSSAASPHHHLPYTSLFPQPHGPTSAPPPTPSSLYSDDSNNLLPRSSNQGGVPAADTLSRLLQRQLTPNLSLPSRFRSSTTTTTTPTANTASDVNASTFSLSSLNPDNNIINKLLAESACKQGFFLLSTDHGITSELVKSSESDSISLFSLPNERKRELFSHISNWPVGYHEDEIPDEDDENNNNNRKRTTPVSSFCLDKMTISSIAAVAAPDDDQPLLKVKLSCLEEMIVELERVGMEVIGKIFSALGLIREEVEGKKGLAAVVGKLCSFMWVSEYDEAGSESERVEVGRYPYVVALEYQVRSGRKYCLETDTGLVYVAPPVDSVLVMLGDIAQVWTNGKTKKVRGRPIPAINNNNNNTDDVSTSKLLTMTLLITLPLESTVSSLLSTPTTTLRGNIYGELEISSSSRSAVEEEEENDVVDCGKNGRVFRSFSFEDYCWRVYHDNQRRLMSYKDPLDRYRKGDVLDSGGSVEDICSHDKSVKSPIITDGINLVVDPFHNTPPPSQPDKDVFKDVPARIEKENIINPEKDNNTPPGNQPSSPTAARDEHGKIINPEAEADECIKLLLQLGCQVPNPAQTKANIVSQIQEQWI